MMAAHSLDDKVYFGNLPFSLTEEELSDFAKSAGNV
jgi:hypothetical protein